MGAARLLIEAACCELAGDEHARLARVGRDDRGVRTASGPAPPASPTMTRGVAFIERPEAPALLLFWVAESAGLRLGSVALRSDNRGRRLSMSRMQPHFFAPNPDGFHATGVASAKILAALWSVIPERAPTESDDVRPRCARSSSITGRDNEGATRIIYATRSTSGRDEPASMNSRAPSVDRWRVRGHWRNQWRPSIKAHKRIWIEEHTAGAIDGQLIASDRVYVLAPLAPSPSANSGRQ